MRGIEDTEAFQTRDNFVIPVEAIQLVNGQWTIVFPETSDTSPLNYRDNSIGSKLYTAAQECKAQISLMGYSSPDHYRNKIMGDADFQPYHGDVEMTAKGIAAFGTDFTDRQDGDLTTEEARGNHVICLSDKYTDKYKADQGGPSPYIGLYEPREPTGFTLETTSPMISHEKYGIVCGLIPDNDHIVNDRYWNYLKSFQTVPSNWDNWDRIVAIMLFDPLHWDEALIETVVQDWESRQR